VKIIQRGEQEVADLIIKCSCKCVFEYEYRDIFLAPATNTMGFYRHPYGQVQVECPSCRTQIEVGSYELRSSVSDGQELRQATKKDRGAM